MANLTENSTNLTVAENSPATAIAIPTPSDTNFAAPQLAVTVTALPSSGTVLLPDGKTPLSVGEALTVSQLTGLQFQPTPNISDQSSAFAFTVSDPAGNTAPATASLVIASNATARHRPLPGGVGPGSSGQLLGSPLNISTPLEAASPVTYTITSLPAPTIGIVVAADGTTPIGVGQTLSPGGLAGLRFRSSSSSIPPTIDLGFNENFQGQVVPVTATVPVASPSNLGTGAVPPPPFAPAATPINPNPIVLENQKPGAPQSDWQINPGQDSKLIQGFTTSISTNLGGTVQFKIDNKSGNGNYQIEIYRLGYYGGLGATLVTTLNHSATPGDPAQVQPAPIFNPATGTVDAGNWTVTDSWAVPSNDTSGVYVANVVEGQQVFQIPFVITDNSSSNHSDIIFQTNDETWQAYNGYGGANLYGFTSAGGSNVGPSPRPPGNGGPAAQEGAAFAVSYNRPILTRDSIGYAAGPQNSVFGAEYAAIYWLEQNGYNVSYQSGIDTATNDPSLLLNHKVFMDAGHDEYWTADQFNNVQAAANAGVNLAFLSGNELFWKTRLLPSFDSSQTPDRTLVAYKDTHVNQLRDPSGVATGTFQDPRLGTPAMPPNELNGQFFQADGNDAPNFGPSTYTIPYGETKLRVWRNTSVADTPPGGKASLEPNLLGYEWDSSPDNGFMPAGTVDLSSSTINFGAGPNPAFNTFWGSIDTSGSATNNIVEFRDPQDPHALIFGTGSVFWSWGLSTQHDNSPYPFSSNTTDPRVQQAMVNELADMGVQPQTLQTTLAIASQSTDTTPPTSTISSVSNNNPEEGQPVTVSGTATDVGGGVIGGVQVSTDSGQTWHPASSIDTVGSASVTWTYSFNAPAPQKASAPGTYLIQSRAVDDSANLEKPGAGVSYTVRPSSALSLFSPSAVPLQTANDPHPYELGVKFTAVTSGQITGIRYYKTPTNTGTHTGELWSSTGRELASATFTNETASGWQQANFATPVPITDNTTYVASYHTDTGNYAVTPFYFSTYTGQTNGSLNAPGNGLNGVFAPGATAFPTNVWTDDNYWVDVVFKSGGTTQAPPVLHNVAASASWISGAAPTVLSSGTTISDGPTLVSGSVSISSGLLAGDTLAAMTTGTSIAASYNASTGVLNLTGRDTLAHYQQVLGSVSFSSTSTDPTNAGANPSRLISWVVNDGTQSSTPQTTTLAVSNGTPPTSSLFSPSTVPGTVTVTDDPNAVSLGVKFQAATSGTITALRFYKGPQNTGPHEGDLWSSTGTLLASATFTNETASGWQQVNLPTPVPITAGNTYIAAYHTASGLYSADSNFFTNALTRGQLTAPSSESSGGNGVFAYGSSALFPRDTFHASNYYVDAVFSPAPPVLHNVAASASWISGAAPTVLSSGTTISDGPTLVSGSVSISSGLLAGDTLAAMTTGTSIAASYNASTGVLNLTGRDTLAHYQQVLGSVSFSSTSTDPTNAGANPSRLISWVVNDGTQSSTPQTTTLAVSNGTPPTSSLFSPSTVPGTVTVTDDPNAVSLGVKFQAATSGTITALRFYKGPQNTGPHEGDLWSSTGKELASATFTNETASGWQQVNLPTPVPITAGNTYIAAYHTASGLYSADSNFFTNALTRGQLTAPSSESSGGNGVFAYGSSALFPRDTFHASNYYVDAVFKPQLAG